MEVPCDPWMEHGGLEPGSAFVPPPADAVKTADATVRPGRTSLSPFVEPAGQVQMVRAIRSRLASAFRRRKNKWPCALCQRAGLPERGDGVWHRQGGLPSSMILLSRLPRSRHRPVSSSTQPERAWERERVRIAVGRRRRRESPTLGDR